MRRRRPAAGRPRPDRPPARQPALPPARRPAAPPAATKTRGTGCASRPTVARGRRARRSPPRRSARADGFGARGAGLDLTAQLLDEVLDRHVAVGSVAAPGVDTYRPV